jgi:hypothetical protein
MPPNHVCSVRNIVAADRLSGAPGAAGRAHRVLLAFRPPGEMAVRRPVRGRVVRGADRQRGALVHGTHRHPGDHGSSRPVPGRDLADARRHGAGGAGGAPVHRPATLSHHEPGDCGTVHQPDPLAGPLARGAAELGVLPERLRGPHLNPRDADRTGRALDAHRLGHRALVHFGLRRDRDRHDGIRRPVAGNTAAIVVCRLCRVAGLFRAAHARPLQGQFGGALRADRTHRRQLHQHPHRQAVRAGQRRRPVRPRRHRPSHRSFSPRSV